MTRYCRIINVKSEYREEYIKLHQQPREEIQKVMKDNGIKSHAIFIRGNLLVSCFEYDGSDFDKDMKRISEHPATEAWWKKTSPLQEPLADADDGDWWTFLEPVTSYE